MENQLIECIPNFSEGRDTEIIDQIANEVINTSNVHLLHIDVGYDANRTVMTFIGEPKSVCKAAFKAISKAGELIDMSTHKGTHPRIGATDVCPLVPISNIEMPELSKLARKLAEDVGNLLGIPCFCYAESSFTEGRYKLEDCRRGEYEGITNKIAQEKWKPDFGPNIINKKSGISIIGAREILIAYNVSLNSYDINIAKKIAGLVRESGIKGNKPGILRKLKAIGWDSPEYGCVQVSTNLIDYKQTTLHEVFDTIKKLANELNIDVLGSEIIGLVPLKAILDAGFHYAEIQNLKITEEQDLLQLAIEQLSLNLHAPFIPEERIIEYKLNSLITP